MATDDVFLGEPALHPRLRELDARDPLRARWQGDEVLLIEEVLQPGLAAELAAFLPRLPLAAQFDAPRQELSWRCAVGIAPEPDPQYPECAYRLLRFLDRDLPGLAEALTSRAFLPGRESRIDVHVFRKGSYLDAGFPMAPPGGLDFILGLTGPRWPAGAGGHLQILDEAGEIASASPIGWDTLHLFAHRRTRVTLVERHVEGLLVRGFLRPAAGHDVGERR